LSPACIDIIGFEMAGTDHKKAVAQELLSQNGLQPAVILVAPQLGENIGSVARAMLNCGLIDLRLVNPRDGWPNPAADAMASGAIVVLEQARVFTSVEEAIGDLHRVYATTARGRDMLKPIVTPRKAAQDIHQFSQSAQRSGILFGPERAGLNNEDLVYADALLMVPLHPGFSSLNLAQAVLLVAYEWFQGQDAPPSRQIDLEQNQPASRNMLKIFFDRLETSLEDNGYFRSPDLRPTIWRNIRNLFLRMEPSEQDIHTLHGVLTAISRKTVTIAPPPSPVNIDNP